MTDDLPTPDEHESPDPTNADMPPQSPLADDMMTSIDNLVGKAELGESNVPDEVPISPTQALETVRMPLYMKASMDPDAVLGVLAVVHEETGALLAKHADEDTATLANETLSNGGE
jgi:hypothetical protein